MRTYAPRGSLLLVFSIVFLPLAAAAEVQVKVLPDGTKLVYNESEAQRARRTATRLVPVPSPETRALIDLHARRQGLSPRLVQAVMQVESGYNPKALSRKGAMGLMQLMPTTARQLHVADPYDPEQNIRGGTTYLRQMLQRYSENLNLALAAYNAGPTAVDKYRAVPPYRETRDYVRKVLGLYRGTSSTSRFLLQEHARTQSRQRRQTAQETAEEKRGGEAVYLTRDETGRIVVTTTSPKTN